jgi:RimJ/RimL family protein N-acetyltransferase
VYNHFIYTIKEYSVNKMRPQLPLKFESERLILRCYMPGDGKWYYAMSLRNHEHLMRYEAENVAANIPNEESAEKLVRDLAAEWEKGSSFFIGAFEKRTGEFVAQIYVGPVDWNLPEFQIGYFVEAGHEGRGYVTEAVKETLKVLFTLLNAHRISLHCNESNLRSIRVAERCGMVREGRLRENKRSPDGAYSNSLIYGLLKSEYTAFLKR